MPTISRSIAMLSGFDFNFLKDRYASDFIQHTPHFDRYAEELRKFLLLPCLHDGPLAAMSHGVDALWHTFITHTPQYFEFCDAVYGRYLHHQPRSEQHPVPPKAISNFYRAYPDRFGEVPDTWFEDIPPAHIVAVRLGRVPSAVKQLRWSGWPGWN